MLISNCILNNYKSSSFINKKESICVTPVKQIETINNYISFGKKINANDFHVSMLSIPVSFKGILNKENKRIKYPEDNEYRKTLAKHVGCQPDDLVSIAGKQELLDILSKLTFQNFHPGENLKNVNDGTFKVNMHIHTLDSDGKMTVEQILDKAVNYADNIKDPPFVLSITNHDICNDSRKAIEIISKNPEKYKNILFVPGMEISAKIEDSNCFNIPIQLELLCYCFNPYDKELNDFIENNRLKNLEYAEKIISKANKYKLNANLEEAKQYHNLLNIGGSPAFLWLLKRYLVEKANEKVANLRIISNVFEKHERKYGTIFVSKDTPSIEKLLSTFNSALLSIAHPGRISLDGLKKGVSCEKAIDTIFDKFTSFGGIAAEINYFYSKDYYDEEGTKWLNYIREYAAKKGIISTGGIDSHNYSLYEK